MDKFYRTDLINGVFGPDGLTNEVAAELSDLNKNTISKIRSGKDVKISSLRSFARAAKIPLPKLFEPKDEPAPAA